MSPLEIIGLIATVLTILSMVIAVAVRLSSFPAERKISSLEKENQEFRKTIDNLSAQQARLVETLTLYKTAASDVGNLKEEIDQELESLAQMMNVNSASILIPYPPVRSTRFAFLSSLGDQKSKDRLKNLVIPISKGIAGQVYSSGQPTIVGDPKTDRQWNSTVDKRIAFQTQNLLCLPLKFGSNIVGVVQFLNKADSFTDQDRQVMESAISTLSYKVGKFTQRVENFELLGLGHSNIVDDGTVLITDLSSSSSLLRGTHPLSDIDVINLVNEYLERTTTVAQRNGCIVDKFMWDGCIFSLNVFKPVKDHQLVAYRTALELCSVFNELKASWLRADLPAEKVFFRVAVVSGPILQVDMGPAQYRQKTVVGDPLVAASALRDKSPRDRNIIVVDKIVYDAVASEHIKATRVKPAELGKAQGLIVDAYYLDLPQRL